MLPYPSISFSQKIPPFHTTYPTQLGSRVASVSTVTKLQTGQQENSGSIPRRNKRFFYSLNLYQLWSPPSLFFKGYRGFFSQQQSSRSVKLTTVTFSLAPRLRTEDTLLRRAQEILKLYLSPMQLKECHNKHNDSFLSNHTSQQLIKQKKSYNTNIFIHSAVCLTKGP